MNDENVKMNPVRNSQNALNSQQYVERSASNGVKMSPKDFFLYVLAMIALYVSAFSLLALLFEYIDILFPDELETYRDRFSSAVRFSISSLIIIFPVYLFLTRFLNKDIRAHPEKRNLGIRKWLIYFTLFVAGITIIIDLIMLVNGYLGGELTTRFSLKAFSVLIVAGVVFWYYISALKGKWERDARQSKRIGLIVSALVLASVISGFFIIGSPQTQRLLRFDMEKVNDLQNIQWQIVNYWQNKNALPETLSNLEDSISGFIVPTDPQSGEQYEYNVISSLKFELCADFNKESVEQLVTNARIVKPIPVGGGFMDTPSADGWEHREDRNCFERTIDPDLYPLRKER